MTSGNTVLGASLTNDSLVEEREGERGQPKSGVSDKGEEETYLIRLEMMVDLPTPSSPTKHTLTSLISL